MFRWFENRVTPYPATAPAAPPKNFFAFLWTCSEGLRPYLLGMTLCTAVIGAFEALLFAMLGRVVDWLAAVEPARLWTEQRGSLLLLAAILAVISGRSRPRAAACWIAKNWPESVLSLTSP